MKNPDLAAAAELRAHNASLFSKRHGFRGRGFGRRFLNSSTKEEAASLRAAVKEEEKDQIQKLRDLPSVEESISISVESLL